MRVHPEHDGSEKNRSENGGSFKVQKAENKTTVADTVNYKRRMQKKPWYILDPRHSRFMAQWDMVTVFALVFTALFTPVEVSFLTTPSTYANPLFLFNRFIDCVFIIDLVLNFFIMFPSESLEGARYIFEPGQIARHCSRAGVHTALLSFAPCYLPPCSLLDTLFDESTVRAPACVQRPPVVVPARFPVHCGLGL